MLAYWELSDIIPQILSKARSCACPVCFPKKFRQRRAVLTESQKLEMRKGLVIITSFWTLMGKFSNNGRAPNRMQVLCLLGTKK